jgi:neutral ceramidase
MEEVKVKNLERFFAVLKGEKFDSLPFAADINWWYRVNKEHGTMPEEYKHMSLIEVARATGVIWYFWLGNESTVGQNSRLLLKDNTISWGLGRRVKQEALRPTGPFDPDLPVISFKREDGSLEALLFNHSTHNVETRCGGVRSSGFYGLAAQELEEELGGTVLFLPGAFGSTHNLTLSADEMILRIKDAVKEAFSELKQKANSNIVSVKQEFEYQVRKFDEEKEEEAVSYYCNKRESKPRQKIKVFRKMRRELSKHQGETRKSWLQVILLGETSLVGVPGELFTKLGIQIKRCSPLRQTYVVGLANDYIGYIPDKQAFDLGGYQTWTGFHSLVERGTGEAIVEKTVRV